MKPRFFLTENEIIKSYYGFISEDAAVNPNRKPEIQTDTIGAFFKALNDFASSGKQLHNMRQNIPYQKEVEVIQAGLNYLGFPLPKHGVDGLFGPETEAAVKAYQKTKGIQETGIVDSSMAKSLVTDLQGKNFDQNKLKDYLGDNVNYLKGADLLRDPAFIAKLQEISKNLRTNPSYIAQVMQAESGLNPKATNPVSGACGLIGFMPSTAASLGTSPFELKKMSGVQQLEYVEKYYRPYTGKLNSFEDVYTVTYYPNMLGKPMDYIVGSEKGEAYAKKVAVQNPTISRGKEFTTKQDFYNYLGRTKKLSIPQLPGPRFS